MQAIKLKDLEAFLKSEPFQYIRLLDKDKRSVIVAFNSKAGDIPGQTKKMMSALNSKIYDDGMYYVCFRSTLNGREKMFAILKGNGSEAAEQIGEPSKVVATIPIRELSQDEPLSREEIIELNRRIIQLEMENDRLRDQIASMEAEDEDLSEEPESLIDPGTTNFIKEVGLPLLDKFLDMYSERNTILKTAQRPQYGRSVAGDPRARTTPAQPAQQQQQAQQQQMSEAEELANYFLNATLLQLRQDFLDASAAGDPGGQFQIMLYHYRPEDALAIISGEYNQEDEG